MADTPPHPSQDSAAAAPVDPADRAFRLADWHIDPIACRLTRGDQHHKIEPKAMTVLLCLARQPGQVLSRQQLEQQAWQGVVVGYDSLASAIIKLRKALGDDSRAPRYIETVPKRGYRLIAEVIPLPDKAATASSNSTPPPNSSNARDAAATPNPINTSSSSSTKPASDTQHLPTPAAAKPATPPRSWLPAALVIIALLVAALLYSVLNRAPPPQPIPEPTAAAANPSANPDRKVIVVLPFRNLSDDSQQDYFSDGITADLITDLSKVSGLSVIARNSVFVYKDSDIDMRRIKEELGANWAVEGSVRRRGERVRISARLVDTSTGINLWAERFDGDVNKLFEFQDQVTAQVIESLSIQLTERDHSRLAHKYSDSIAAYDEFLRGWQSLWLSSRDGMVEARRHLQRAIALDPGFARAYANLALTWIWDHLLGWSNDAEESLRLAHHYADRAIALDDRLPQVHWVKGFADILARDYQSALDNAQHAIDLDPSFADAYGLLATTLNYAGEPRQAEREMRKAMRLNPRYPAVYRTIYGEIQFNLRNYPQAIDNFRFVLDSNPESEEPRLWLAAAYAQSGDIDEAEWQLELFEAGGGELSLTYMEQAIPLRDPAQRKHFIDGLYKAGLREHSPQ